jgi:cAMP-dependent protein kinase regulator
MMIKQTYGFILKNEKDFLKEITNNPKNVHSLLRLGDLFLTKNKLNKAIEFYNKAASILEGIGKNHGSDAIYRLIYKLSPEEKDYTKMITEKSQKTEKIKKINIHDIKRALKNVEIFKGISEEDMDELANFVKVRKFSPGDIIIRQGEEGDSLFIIVYGSVKIYYDDQIGKVIELTYLSQGDFFGEMGFMGDKKRKASVSSVDETLLLEISREELDKIIKKNPEVEKILLRYYQERILDLIIAINPLFEPLSHEVRKEIIKKFHLQKFPENTIIIKEGELSSAMYLIKSGTVSVYKEEKGEKIKIAQLEPGDFFGEIGVITGQKRTATVITKTEVEVMELTKDDISFIIGKYPEILNILKDYIRERTTDTFSKLMELKRLSAKKGLV